MEDDTNNYSNRDNEFVGSQGKTNKNKQEQMPVDKSIPKGEQVNK